MLLRGAAALIAAFGTGAATGPAAAQQNGGKSAAAAAPRGSVSGVPNAMQGFSQNRDKPINIEADSLEVRDKDKIATFSGTVKVVQGDTTLRSKSLLVFYEQNEAGSGTDKAAGKGNGKEPSKGPGKMQLPGSGGDGGRSAVRRLEAKGDVVVTQNDQTVTGAAAVFDTRANTITMVGGVVLTKGQDVLRGDRLVVDMTTGVSRIDGGRVQGLFHSGNSNGAGAPGAPLPLGRR